MRRFSVVPAFLAALLLSGPPARAVGPVPPVAFALTAATAKAMTMQTGTCSYEIYNGDGGTVFWSAGTANSSKPTNTNGSGVIPAHSFKDLNDVIYQPTAGTVVIWLYSVAGTSSGVVTWNGFCS